MTHLVASLSMVGALSLPLVSTADDDFDHWETNYNLRHGDFGGQLRVDIGKPNNDHIQLSWYDIFDTEFRFDFRYVNNQDTPEYRPRISYEGWKWGRTVTFKLKPRLEYRIFDGDEKNDYSRIQLIPSINGKAAERWTLWGEFEPSWNVFGSGDGQNDFGIDSSKFVVGTSYKISKNVSFGPFVEYDMDKDWHKKDLFTGTNLSITF